MSNVQVLSSAQFAVRGNQRKALALNMSGTVLVYFRFSTGCPNCKKFDPIFNQLSTMDRRVAYASIDLTQYRDVVQMSRQTSTPIDAVPAMILYLNGIPHARFNGAKNVPSIQNFLTKALENNAQAPPQQQFSGNMYGGGAAAASGGSFGPQKGSAGFAPQIPGANGSGKAWMPEIGDAPSMRGVLKGSGGKQPQIDDEEDEHLMMPASVIPYNTPWEGEYRTLGE